MTQLKQTQDSIELQVLQDFIAPPSLLPDHIEQNIDTISALRTKAENDATHYQLLIEDITAFFGRPVFLLSLLSIIGLWITINLLPHHWHTLIFDPPPFDWLEKSISLASFIMTGGILVRQSRQEQLAHKQAQLILQLNLSSEQKVTKLIALFEELRKDLPNVENRCDREAEIMQQSADPHLVMNALEESIIQNIV